VNRVAQRLVRVIFDRPSRSCLPVDVCFAPKADLRPDAHQYGCGFVLVSPRKPRLAPSVRDETNRSFPCLDRM
jgi:hypothetical protein